MIGTAFLGGGLIGAGANLIRDATVTHSTITALFGSGLVGTGAGVLVGDGASVVQAALSGQALDPKDILINSAATGAAGFFTGFTSSFSAVEALIFRAIVNATASSIASGLSDAAHGRTVDWGKAALSGSLSALAGTAVDKIGLNPLSRFGNAEPYSPLARFYGSQAAEEALRFGFKNALVIQGPLNLANALIVNK